MIISFFVVLPNELTGDVYLLIAHINPTAHSESPAARRWHLLRDVHLLPSIRRNVELQSWWVA